MLVAATTVSVAQKVPKKEFTVSMSEKEIVLVPGKTQTVDITINRSKSYKKAKIKLGLGSTLPEGVAITFANGENPLTDRIMTIKTDESVAPFSKTLLLKAKSSRVSKGIMFSLSHN